MDERPAAGVATIWLTGISGAGKTTLARALVKQLGAYAIARPSLLDGEELRARPDWSFGHGLEDRFAVLEKIVDVALEENKAGKLAVVATISHLRSMRARARERLGRMFEVHVACPPEVCAARDKKGHWSRARAGEYECFVGVTEPYEPSTPDLVIDTSEHDVARASSILFAAVVRFLASSGALR